jgi:hypothetical protein
MCSLFFGVLSYSGMDMLGSLLSHGGIWRVKVHLRVSFFVWIATLGKILTMDNLQKK